MKLSGINRELRLVDAAEVTAFQARHDVIIPMFEPCGIITSNEYQFGVFYIMPAINFPTTPIRNFSCDLNIYNRKYYITIITLLYL